MCSVRHRPMPSAPNLRAVSASTRVSALVRTFMRRSLSAQPIMVAKSPESCGCTVAISPTITSPVPPSSVMTSPAFSVRPLAVTVWVRWSMCSSPAPHTHGRPMPRATTAAWLVMPPRLVRMPAAACMPWMSSGLVSSRTRITVSPSWALASASSAVITILPEHAPGEAGRPRVITLRAALGSSVGCRSWSSEAGGTRITASCSVIMPSLHMSTAILMAAEVVRLPVRVCSK